MKVAIYGHSAAMSGAEIALLNTVANMRALEVHVFLGEEGPLVHALKARGVAVTVVPLSTTVGRAGRGKIKFDRIALKQALATITYAIGLHREMRAVKPSVILSNTMKGHVIIAASCLWMQFPVVCYVRDHVTRDFMSSAAVALMRLILRVVPASLVANSRSTLASVPRLTRARARAVITSPIVIPAALPRKMPSDAIVKYVHVGRIAEWKGQLVALEAIAALLADGVRAHLTLVGGVLFNDVEYEQTLKNFVQRAGISDFVSFAGHVDDVYEFIRAADVLLHTSVIPEPFGQVVVQGMASGVAVIAANEGGPAEVVRDNVDGLLFEPRDADDLATKMRYLAENPDVRGELGRRARQASFRFGVEPIVAEVERILAAAARR